MIDDIAVAHVMLALQLSAEMPFTKHVDMLLRVINDVDQAQSIWATTPTQDVPVRFHNGPGDRYRVVVHVKGYRDAGAVFTADPKVHKTLKLLLIPDNATLTFPTWVELKANHPTTAKLIGGGVSEQEAEARYLALGKEKPLPLASLMNLSAAMSELEIGGGKTPMDFIKEVIWDDTLKQDRFFGYADPAIIPLVHAASADDEFARERGCAFFHKDATQSYKQVQFDYSNVQLTFHEKDTKMIGDVECIKIEPDMDLYKDIVAHGLGEVVPNLSTHRLTSPLDVLALRFTEAVQGEQPLFDPGYLLA